MKRNCQNNLGYFDSSSPSFEAQFERRFRLLCTGSSPLEKLINAGSGLEWIFGEMAHVIGTCREFFCGCVCVCACAKRDFSFGVDSIVTSLWLYFFFGATCAFLRTDRVKVQEMQYMYKGEDL